MTEIQSNSNLAGKISSISLILFFVSFVLSAMKILGGLPIAIAGIGGLVGAILGLVSKNTRAVIFGIIPFILTIALILIGLYVKSQGIQ